MELYDYLLSLGPAEESAEAGFISNVIAELSKDEKETVYALILHHFAINGGVLNTRSIPYSGITFQNGRGVLFNKNKLPQELIYILTHCINAISGKNTKCK